VVSEKGASGFDDARGDAPNGRQAFIRRLPLLVVISSTNAMSDIFSGGGDIRTVANLYEELGLYKEMVECYVAQDEDEEAEKIVRAQLAKERTPYMLSIMGFIKDDVSWYVLLN